MPINVIFGQVLTQGIGMEIMPINVICGQLLTEENDRKGYKSSYQWNTWSIIDTMDGHKKVCINTKHGQVLTEENDIKLISRAVFKSVDTGKMLSQGR